MSYESINSSCQPTPEVASRYARSSHLISPQFWSQFQRHMDEMHLDRDTKSATTMLTEGVRAKHACAESDRESTLCTCMEL